MYLDGLNPMERPVKSMALTSEKRPPILSIVGKSNSGKTTLVVKLIAALRAKGFKVGTIKHDVHGFELDHPGKDSYRHKKAGALTTIISSPTKIGMVREVTHDHSPDELLTYFGGMDIILTEGYKRGGHYKIEVFRKEIHEAPFCLNDERLLALVCDDPVGFTGPRFITEDVEGIVAFLIERFKLKKTDQKLSGEPINPFIP